MSNLQSYESIIVGYWKVVGNGVQADSNCSRIDDLVTNYLIEIGRDFSGWEILYRDPADGRLWELTYPHGDMHGGGPPTLRQISIDSAQEKYRNASTT